MMFTKMGSSKVTHPLVVNAVEQGDPLDDHRAYKRCLGQFSTGVAIMTTMAEGKPVGVTANSFTSLSIEPPLILWSIGCASRSCAAFQQSRVFVVNILSVDQVALSQRFASTLEDKFDGVGWSAGSLGSPILAGILATLECETETIHQGGDHIILVGRVKKYARFAGNALLFSQGRYAVAEDHPTLLVQSPAAQRSDARSRTRDMHLVTLLSRVEMRASDAFERYRQSEGLNLPQSRTIFALGSAKEMSFDEIVQRSNLPRESVEDALSNLAERRFIGSSNGAFSLTDSGRNLFAKLLTQIDRFETEQFKDIPRRDLAVAREVLEKLYDRLKPSTP